MASTYANTLLKKSHLKSQHSYRRQAEQSAREQGQRRRHRGKEKVVSPPASPHSEDCPIGEAEKDMLVGKLLEDRALEISAVAREIHAIQQEWHRERRRSKGADGEPCSLRHPKLKEVEDRERELENIKEEIMGILRSRDEEKSSKTRGNKLGAGPNSRRPPPGGRPPRGVREEDLHESGDEEFDRHGPWRYSCKPSEDAAPGADRKDVDADADADASSEEEEEVEEDGQDTIDDVEKEISFIEGLLEEDLWGRRADPAALDALRPLGRGETEDLVSDLTQQIRNPEFQYLEMKNLLEELEREGGW